MYRKQENSCPAFRFKHLSEKGTALSLVSGRSLTYDRMTDVHAHRSAAEVVREAGARKRGEQKWLVRKAARAGARAKRDGTAGRRRKIAKKAHPSRIKARVKQMKQNPKTAVRTESKPFIRTWSIDIDPVERRMEKVWIARQRTVSAAIIKMAGSSPFCCIRKLCP